MLKGKISFVWIVALFVLSVFSEADISTRARVRHRVQRRAAPSQFSPFNTTHGLAGNYGIDISGQDCDGSSWKSAVEFPCFASKGKDFAIIEAIQGGYGPTTSIAYCASQAHLAGLAVSLYAFMCPNCRGNNPPATVAAALVNNLKNKGVNYTYMYIDVEQCSGCWNSYAANVAFLKQVISGAQSAGARIAIYSNAYEWGAVTGGDTSFSQYPLWYAHYDGNPSFSDFAPFGGWTAPHMKQYNDHSDVGCYNAVDVNWYP